MNEQLAKPLNEMIRGAQIEVPEQIRKMIEKSIDNTRTSWDVVSSSLNNAATSQTNATKTLSDQVWHNMTTNFDATLDMAQALTKAKTLSEVQSVQANFFREHITRTMNQWNEWLNFSMKLSEEAAATVSAMATAAKRTAKRR